MTLPRPASTTVEHALRRGEDAPRPAHVRSSCSVCVAVILIVPAAVHSAPGTSDEVHYTFTGPTSVTFNWRGTGTDIRYGPTTSYGTTVASHAPSPIPFSSAGPWQEADLTGLRPGDDVPLLDRQRARHTFTTAPTGSFRFDAVGDIGSSLADVEGDDRAGPDRRRQPRVRADGRRPHVRRAARPGGGRPALQRRHGVEPAARRTCPPGGTTSTRTRPATTSATTRAASSSRTRRPRPAPPRRVAAARTGAGSTPAGCGSSPTPSRTRARPGRTGRRRPARSWPPRRQTRRSRSSSRTATDRRTRPATTRARPRWPASSTGSATRTRSTC